MSRPIRAPEDAERIRLLAAWWRRHARDLPWRRRRDARPGDGYAALVAEAMLQQTQVARVVERYEPFLDRFPTPADLAVASEQAVLAMWQGLGYYRRALNLQRAARVVVERFDGIVPADAAALRELPGVGRYTAAAIASIVHGRREALVDGNVQRVLARWDAEEGSPADPRVVRRTWARAEALVEAAPDPAVLNEALMELGAVVCTPGAPRCEACPTAAVCRARARGLVDRIPPAKPRAVQRAVHHHAVVASRGDRLLVEQRGPAGLWARMWQVPTVEADRRLAPESVLEELRRRGAPMTRVRPLGSFPYQTTHRRITFHVFAGTTRLRRGRWATADGLAELPMSNAQRRVLEMYHAQAGSRR